MNKSYYTNIKGQNYSLTENTTKDKEKMEQMDKITRNKAIEMANDSKMDVFYALKYYDDFEPGWKRAQYFLIPIERSEVQNIIQEYAKSAWIGIAYRPDDSNIKDETPVQENLQKLSGYDYEKECAEYLKEHGFTSVEVTKKSGDQGIDVIGWKDGKKYGFQCKYYSGTVPNKAVQEAHTGAVFYDCDVAVVMTTGRFSQSAVELARKIGVKLWTNQ